MTKRWLGMDRRGLVKAARAWLLAGAVTVGAAMATPVASAAPATQEIRSIDCSSLLGAGSYSNPKRVGAITQVTIVYDCPPLTSGRPFNVTYFAFALPGQPTPDAGVLTSYAAGSRDSGVHPRLAWGAQTTKGSLSAAYYNDGQFEGFYHSMNDLWAGNAWLVGAEKLSSPLGSLQTAWYTVTFVP
jgi:hypothetical protein